MAFTYSKLAETTVGAGGASSIIFNNIPQNYTDLVLKVSLRSDRGSGARQDNPFLTFNGTTTGYTEKRLYGTGSAAASANWTSGSIVLGNIPASSATVNTFGNIEVYIPNYAGSFNKSMSVDGVQEDNQTEAYAELDAGLWSSPAAISTLLIALGSTWKFVQYSTATLYGIRVEL
jgi:hypothetical protein